MVLLAGGRGERGLSSSSDESIRIGVEADMFVLLAVDWLVGWLSEASYIYHEIFIRLDVD